MPEQSRIIDARAPRYLHMPRLRHYSKLLLWSLCLFRTCFGQSNTTCLPLYGGDSLHPNGLFIQLAPLKPQRQNSTSTYIAQVGTTYSQALWDATQGPYGIPGSTIQSTVQAELASCVPGTIVALPLKSNTPLTWASHVLAIADFNSDGVADVALVVPGSNQVSVYLGNPDGTFQAPVNTTAGNAATRLSSIAVADFNNDKKIDVAVADTANNVVYILFNKGDGHLNLLPPVTLQVGHAPVSLTIADVNLDGNADVVVANSADNTVSVIRGYGDGTFIPGSTFAVGKNPVSVIVQDMNGDGNPDLVVADNGSSDIAVLFGNGNGGFQTAQTTKTPAPPTYLASADFNNDGVADLVALAEDANAVMMFTGNYQGKLTLAGAYLVPNLSASLSINDFNGDGNLDLLIPDTDRGSPVLLLGRGDGTLNAPPVYAGSTGSTSLATADFNNDGKADLIVPGATSSSLSLLLGNGNGQFQAPVNIPVAGPTGVVAVGDFNRDGRTDMAVSSGSQLSILLNAGNGTFQQGASYPSLIPSVVADFNKDGVLDIAGPSNGSLGLLLGNGDGTFHAANPTAVGSNPTTAAAADFNKDGALDLAVLNAGTIGNPNDPGGISILLGNGSGTFPKVSAVSAGLNPRALAVGDMNGDGFPDLIVATGVTASTYQVSVFLGKGDGTFQSPFNIPLPAGQTPGTITVLDIDGDGKLDVVLGGCCTDAAVSYLRGNGDGTLQPLVPFYGGNDARGIVVGDWNGDGKPDLAIAYAPADNTSLSGVVPLVNHLANVNSLVNTSGASFLPGPIAPDSIVSAFGTNLTTATASATGDPSSLPTTLANTTVTVKDSKGTTRQAQLYYVSPTQINYLVPAATALGMTTVAVTAPNGITTTQVSAASSDPGMFTINSSGLAAATGTHVQGPYYSSFNVSYVDPTTGLAVPIPINMGAKGDGIFLSLYGTGFRSRTSLQGVAVTLTPVQQAGGTYTPALYAGPQTQYPGLDQLNIQIPQSLAGAGNVSIQVTVDGVAANPVFVTVQ